MQSKSSNKCSRCGGVIMSIRQIYKWIILRIIKRYRAHSEYFLIIDGDWLNNLTDKEI